MDKRSELLKLIANSDGKGIEAIWNVLYEGKKLSFSKQDIIRSSGKVFANMVIENPGILLITDELATFTRNTIKELFKEEK